MNLLEHIEYWLNSAEHDLEVATTLFKNGKYDWCLYICHLVIEKTLKAFWITKNGNKLPPKIHNLVRLAELSGLKLQEDRKLMLDEINDFNISVRYPDYKLSFYKKCTKEFTENYFKEVKEFYKWLKSQIEL